jgi:serine/threonine protein kinase
VIEGKNYDCSCDIFSLGCMMYYFMTGKKKQFYIEVYKDIKFFQNLKQEIQKNFSNEWYNVLIQLLNRDPKNRPTSKELYQRIYDLEPYVYHGEVNVDGIPHGKGKITYSNNNSYEGEFVHGKR